jgi:hypothetical protein
VAPSTPPSPHPSRLVGQRGQLTYVPTAFNVIVSKKILSIHTIFVYPVALCFKCIGLKIFCLESESLDPPPPLPIKCWENEVLRWEHCLRCFVVNSASDFSSTSRQWSNCIFSAQSPHFKTTLKIEFLTKEVILLHKTIIVFDPHHILAMFKGSFLNKFESFYLGSA